MSRSHLRLQANGEWRTMKSAPKNANPERPTEKLLECTLRLMPSIVDAGGALPIWSHGDQACGDQLYLDAFGRLTLVEAKKGQAGVEALVQLLGNSEHARFLSVESLSTLFAASAESFLETSGAAVVALTRPGLKAESVGQQSKRSSILAKVEAVEERLGEEGLLRKLGRAAAERLHPDATGKQKWFGLVDADLSKATGMGTAALSLLGAPPRLVLVAPSFSDDCRELAEKLVARWIDVRLVEVDTYLVGDGDEREWHVSFEPILRANHVERAWAAIAALWRNDEFRGSYLRPEWYQGHKDGYAVFGFGLRRESQAGLLFCIAPECDELIVSTGVPHGFTDGDDNEGRRLAGELADKLPGSHTRKGSDYIWTYKLARDDRRWLDRALELSQIVRDVFTPETS